MPLNYMSRLLEKYRKIAIPAMQKEFGVKNVMAIPKIEKVVINTGIGRIVKEGKTIERIRFNNDCGTKIGF